MWEVNFIALLFCNLFLRAQQAYFSSKPPPGVIKAGVGQDVTFNWTFTLENDESLLLMQLDYSKTDQFERSAKRIAYRLKDTFSISNAFKGRVSVERTGAMTLHNVTVEQSGFYKCDISLEDQVRSIWNKAQLLVGIPPVIHSSHASEITLLEDDHVDISCEASGSPVPNISWYRQLDRWRKFSEHRIQIRNAKLSDSGLYECRAKNSMGSEEKTVKLVVYERPRVRSFFHTAALDDTVYECDAITFTCEASANSLPVKNIYIYHEGRLVHRSIDTGSVKLSGGSRTSLAGDRRRGRLRIAEVRKEHEGKYYCVAENEYGLGYNKTIDLRVYAAPKNCERKREILTTRNTKRQNSSASPTVSDHSLPTTNEQEVLGSHSGAQIPNPSLLVFAMWICHLIFCSVFS